MNTEGTYYDPGTQAKKYSSSWHRRGGDLICMIIDGYNVAMFSNLTDFITQISHYSAHPEEAAEIIQQARNWAKAHTWSERAQRVVKAIQNRSDAFVHAAR